MAVEHRHMELSLNHYYNIIKNQLFQAANKSFHDINQVGHMGKMEIKGWTEKKAIFCRNEWFIIQFWYHLKTKSINTIRSFNNKYITNPTGIWYFIDTRPFKQNKHWISAMSVLNHIKQKSLHTDHAPFSVSTMMLGGMQWLKTIFWFIKGIW